MGRRPGWTYLDDEISQPSVLPAMPGQIVDPSTGNAVNSYVVRYLHELGFLLES